MVSFLYIVTDGVQNNSDEDCQNVAKLLTNHHGFESCIVK